MKMIQNTIIALIFVILVSSSEFVLNKYKNSLLHELEITEHVSIIFKSIGFTIRY